MPCIGSKDKGQRKDFQGFTEKSTLREKRDVGWSETEVFGNSMFHFR
jgi:hypothetical protein